jgi:hypothetical protein
MLAGFAAVGAEAAYFCPGYGDFDAAVAGNLALQLFVEFAFEFADFAAAHAGYVDVIARAVAFVEMAVPAEVEQVELVDQTVVLEEFERAIDGDAGDIGIDLLREREYFAGVQVLRGALHHLQDHTALARQTNAARAELPLQAAGRLVNVDTFAG